MEVVHRHKGRLVSGSGNAQRQTGITRHRLKWDTKHEKSQEYTDTEVDCRHKY